MRGRLANAILFAVSIAAAGAALPGRTCAADPGSHAQARAAMVEVIRDHAWRARSELLGPEVSAPVLGAMDRVPRHRFVPEDLEALAYADRPLPIGYGQTISQPYIVALMTDLLRPAAGDRVLEIGTGSGYQAAVLAELAVEVATVEIIPELAAGAAARLRGLGYAGVAVKHGDGYDGWPDLAPFDGIVVTAAADHVPPPLVAQLKPGARMIIPVGPPFMVQQLVLVLKDNDGVVTTRQLLPVRFVPLTRAP